MKLEKYIEALADFSNAILLCPLMRSYYCNRANCYKILAEHEPDQPQKDYYNRKAKEDDAEAKSLNI